MLNRSLGIFTINGLAQNPNPELFQTWYLNFVQESDAAPIYHVSEIEPTITPTLIILENQNFNGQGACNSFNGTFSIPSSNSIETIAFTNSTDECSIPIHNSFENSYFGFMQTLIYYEIITEGDGLVLTLGGSIFGQAVFKNYTLSSDDFDLNRIKVYPNPSSSFIFVNSPNNDIAKIEFFNSYSQSIKTVKNDFETIDISNLSSGVYIMKIYTEHGIMNKKIIKNNM